MRQILDVTRTSTRFLALDCAVGLWLTAHPPFAQVATGNIACTVKDSSAGVIPGTTVTLISQTRAQAVRTAQIQLRFQF